MKMKVGDSEVEVRIDKQSEQIEFTAHSGVCRYCGEVVKMNRNPETFELQLDNCRCLMCGQPYFVKIEPPETVESWELKQWKQKSQTFAMDVEKKMAINDVFTSEGTVYYVPPGENTDVVLSWFDHPEELVVLKTQDGAIIHPKKSIDYILKRQKVVLELLKEKGLNVEHVGNLSFKEIIEMRKEIAKRLGDAK